MALSYYDGSTHEHSLSESSHSFMSAYYLSAFVLVAIVFSTFRTDQTCFEFSPNSPWAVSPYKTLHTNEMLTGVIFVVLNIKFKLLSFLYINICGFCKAFVFHVFSSVTLTTTLEMNWK